jgi:hypothetical protein
MKRRTFLGILGAAAIAPLVFTEKRVRSKKIRSGKTFFVDSERGRSFFNSGLNPNKPLKTLGDALERVESGRGDFIYMSPDHFEKLNGPIIIDKNNLTISGGTFELNLTGKRGV